MDSSSLQHALVIPHPLQGHITPALHLSHHLASHHRISISFVLPHNLLLRLPRAPPHACIRFIGVSDNLPHDHPRSATFLHAYQASFGMQASVDELLGGFTPGHCHRLPPDFIIADTFVLWAHELALKHGIPSVAFATTNASAMVIMASIPKLTNLGFLPVKAKYAEVSDPLRYDNPEQDLITCIPGFPPLHPCELPLSLRSLSLDHYRIKFVKAQFEEASKASAIIVNTVEEMEKEVLDGFEFNAPAYAIGPALLLGEPKENPPSSINTKALSISSSGGSLYPPQNECLLWLDTQEYRSVVYVAFGSTASCDKSIFVELAFGLEASKRPFLWVIPPHSYCNSVSEILPDGFVERTQGVGMVISWSSQTLVLSHPSLGAFITHGGWNSLLENLSLGGVPMICWPNAAEQALNAKLVTTIWKVGVRVRTQKDGLVHRNEIERVVKLMFLKDETDGFRARALALKDVAFRAVQEGGSSLTNINKVLHIVKQEKLRKILKTGD